ncbi:MAG TPA: hypothetical protein VLJ62_21280 [Burkholderiaceae bacterium]|nr:hypothetical protein [Burkholderiaceae bacterium]
MACIRAAAIEGSAVPALPAAGPGRWPRHRNTSGNASKAGLTRIGFVSRLEAR